MRGIFTPEELEELRRADAEIDAAFDGMTTEERRDIAERDREARRKTPIEVLKRKRAYYRKNRERILERKKAYRKAHREEINAYERQWYAEHREERNQYFRERRKKAKT